MNRGALGRRCGEKGMRAAPRPIPTAGVVHLLATGFSRVVPVVEKSRWQENTPAEAHIRIYTY